LEKKGAGIYTSYLRVLSQKNHCVNAKID